jgi:hypothetical protein
MAGAEVLPAHTAADHGPGPKPSLPPPYPGTTFTVGGWTVSHPLVSIDQQLKSHLRLFEMFTLVRQKVEDPGSDPQFASVV